jgi:hypothetical protein
MKKHSDIRDQATTYILITYALAQAIVTLLMIFDVVQGDTLIGVVTSVGLVLYVAANELLGRPARRANQSAIRE